MALNLLKVLAYHNVDQRLLAGQPQSNILVTIDYLGLSGPDVRKSLVIAICLGIAKDRKPTTVRAHESGRHHVEAAMGLGHGVSPDRRATETQIDEETLALVTRLTNEISWYMRERGLSRAELANRMGVSPGRVSQILSGGENLTLRTLAALSTALDARFGIELTALKGADAYTSRGTAAVEADSVKGHTHTNARPRRLENTRFSGSPRR